MKYDGQAVRCTMLDGNIVELQFNLDGDSVNKLNTMTLKELQEGLGMIKAHPEVRGLLISSGKDCFIVGADITEFMDHFRKADEEMTQWLNQVNRLFSDIEDFDFPTIAAINGFALGGGFELALSTSYRVMSEETKVGLPETKLGIYPGWGGTIRLSRLIGADNAIEWIASGEQWDSQAALKVDAVDAVVKREDVRMASLRMLESAIRGKLDWRARRLEKKSPLKLNSIESKMVFEGAKAFIGAKVGPNYPAPLEAIESMQRGSFLDRDQALKFETAGFVKMAKTPTAFSLVGVFLGDQYLKRLSKKISKSISPVQSGAVLGAGIMGGGIAYQSASKGIPIYMKDIQPKALEIGLKEAVKLLDKQVSRNKLTPEKMGSTLSKIRPTLSYGDFKNVDFVVEAVVENEEVKKAALSDVESQTKKETILSSNTSTISITQLAEGLKRPENFCGMHFFNPVHRMPLVEIIRGKKSSETTVATAVSYALAMGKTPIVVNDCPGFLVNRVLFPYFAGFMKLMEEGADFQKVDKVMEKFGWPMGPAYLLDVIGIDTAHHANSVMAREFPDRMKHSGKTALDLFFENKRYGQKNFKGFYQYGVDKKGALKKESDPIANELISSILKPPSRAESKFSDDEIIHRMMLPMIIECSRCLEEKIVSSPVEVDMGLIYGLGFPPFRGGALRYADRMGSKQLCQIAEKYQGLGKLYEPTEQIKDLAKSGKSFYSV